MPAKDFVIQRTQKLKRCTIGAPEKEWICKTLLSRRRITEDLIDMIIDWRDSGFSVYCGPRMQPDEEEVIENLA